MTDLQIGAYFLAGVLLGIFYVLQKNDELVRLMKHFLVALLTFATLYTLLSLIYFLFMKQFGPSLAWVFVLSLHKIVIFFIDGLITACFLLRWVSVANRTELWVGEFPKVYSFLKYLMAVYFVCSGFSKIIGFSAILVFFRLSGYNVSFLYFIIAFEIIAGIAVLFKRTTAVAALMLMIEMAGATFTHYRNYFVHQVPETFSNSLDSLKMLPFLLVVALLHHRNKSKFLA